MRLPNTFNYCLLAAACLLSLSCLAQFKFSGQSGNPYSDVYLSLVEDYRKINRVYLDQVIMKTSADSLGNFSFNGDMLYPQNRIYRIHVDACGENLSSEHYLGSCEDLESVLFIANNSDTLHFPVTFDTQVFCDIRSTNPRSTLLLEIDSLKEEMYLDFAQLESPASQDLQAQKWFARLQEFGEGTGEPLAELYIYEFLSDKRNAIYNYYLEDLSSNAYYANLSERLQNQYPNTTFTRFYLAEITSDQQLASLRIAGDKRVSYMIYLLLLLSVLLNLWLFRLWRKNRGKKIQLWKRLTPQEKKIVEQIIQEKSNKEIAETLFVSLSTVKTHINNLYKKLGVSDREAVKSLFEK